MKTQNKLKYIQDYGSFIALILLVIVISAISPDFRTVNNFLSLLRQSAINGLIAFGMTCIILTGGIDLSVGSILALTSIICAHTIKLGLPAPLAMITALIFGIILGTISGLMVTKSRLQPFIATLITMTGYRGLTMIISGGKPISRLGNNVILNQIGKGSFLGIPIPVWILLIFFALFLFILKKTVLGREIYATGSNAKAAELAGININKIKLMVYAVSGFMSALSGLIYNSGYTMKDPFRFNIWQVLNIYGNGTPLAMKYNPDGTMTQTYANSAGALASENKVETKQTDKQIEDDRSR